MSLVTRLVGFGLCLLGAFAMGYSQGVQAGAAVIIHEVNRVLSTTVGFAPVVAPLMTTFIQQSANPPLNSYLAIGVVLAACGVFLVARGDPKPKAAKEEMALQPQPFPAKKQE